MEQKGFLAENKALTYLTEQGLCLVMRNYRCRLGEVDLIMSDKEYLVFVEVRARTHRSFGGGLASITMAKQKKIIATTMHYLVAKYKAKNLPAVRFDVISIDGPSGALLWVKDAFQAD